MIGYPVRAGNNGETEYSTRQAAIRVLRCHKGRTKRIVTEDTPDLFLTVAEVSVCQIPQLPVKVVGSELKYDHNVHIQ